MRSWIGRLLDHLRRGAPAYGVLLISLLLTGLAWYYVRGTVEAQNQVRFDEAVQATRAAIERRTDAYLDAMFGARGLFLASEAVEPPEWERYASGIEVGSRLDGLQALGFAERVTPAERVAYVREAEREGLPELRPDLRPGGERSAYFPLKLVAPLNAANRSTLNHDLYPEPAHRPAMERARDTGEPQATGMVYVTTEPSERWSADLALRPGFAVYLPVYREGEPQETVAERRSALEGFVVGTFRRDGLLDDVFAGDFSPAIDFEVYDGGDGASGTLLYDYDGVQRAGDSSLDHLFSERGEITVAGREWGLYFATLPTFEMGAESNLPLFVLLSGIAASLILFGITWMLVRSRLLAEQTSRYLEDANRELEGANQELEAFSYSVSHDLRAPLRSIDGFSQILLEDYADRLDEEGRDYLARVRAASEHMGNLIDDLLDLSRVSRGPLRREVVDLSVMAEGIIQQLRKAQPEREVEFVAEEGIVAFGDVSLLAVALENLLGNAWKFTSGKPAARIEFGTSHQTGPGLLALVYYVRDNGAGFDMQYADKLFGAFQRLHSADEFEGTGIGLATVARIVHRHGGRVWAEG
ncbi:MAG TPA: CHASE domain-containing protein, partial [Rubrobacteraceae bacterium]|nr:CHASE domain-containing protein [Rubrobacteraceae bacterium]